MAIKLLRRHCQCVSEHVLEQWSGPHQGKEELPSSWWTQARWYRNSSGRLGMGPPGKQIAAVLLVDTSKAVQEQQRSTGHGTSRNTAPPQRSQDQGSRRW